MIEPSTPIWPPPKIVQAMQRGIRGVFHAAGVDVAGLRSVHPWIYYADRCGAVCERCGTLEKAPDAPSSRGLNGKPEPLFGPTTIDYALFMLSWLHAFAGRHSVCPERDVAAA